MCTEKTKSASTCKQGHESQGLGGLSKEVPRSAHAACTCCAEHVAAQHGFMMKGRGAQWRATCQHETEAAWLQPQLQRAGSGADPRPNRGDCSSLPKGSVSGTSWLCPLTQQ